VPESPLRGITARYHLLDLAAESGSCSAWRRTMTSTPHAVPRLKRSVHPALVRPCLTHNIDREWRLDRPLVQAIESEGNRQLSGQPPTKASTAHGLARCSPPALYPLRAAAMTRLAMQSKGEISSSFSNRPGGGASPRRRTWAAYSHADRRDLIVDITAVICCGSLGLGRVVASLSTMGTNPTFVHPRFSLATT